MEINNANINAFAWLFVEKYTGNAYQNEEYIHMYSMLYVLRFKYHIIKSP